MGYDTMHRVFSPAIVPLTKMSMRWFCKMLTSMVWQNNRGVLFFVNNLLYVIPLLWIFLRFFTTENISLRPSGENHLIWRGIGSMYLLCTWLKILWVDLPKLYTASRRQKLQCGSCSIGWEFNQSMGKESRVESYLFSSPSSS